MTCEEYIIKRLERAEDDARNIRNAYERNVKRLEALEDKLLKIAKCFKPEEAHKKYYTPKKSCFWIDDDKDVYDILSEYCEEEQPIEDMPF